MSPEQLRQVREIFDQAVRLLPDKRAVFLAQACGDDVELRAEVESLLEHAGQAGDGFLQPLPPLADGVDEPADKSRHVTQRIRDQEWPEAGKSSSPSPQIEGYEIIRELSRGGQGVVYQALQKTTKRKVAVKVLLEGAYASKSAQKRFEREIELVAQLRHPNIISIFHSGTTPDGRPFYVMDYVRGLPLHLYVREKKLTLEETLKLFSTVCEAVQYAHQKGVIHRDLKPTNVLVDADGVPKIMDFGLAKLAVGPVETLVSMTQQVVGTLPYMSPEQARGNPDEIDTRTDVYALGVILYELLTGHYPYPVVGQLAEVLKHIAETPPTPPSRQWRPDSGVAMRASGKSRAGQCPIDDEVQTIVLRALTKERERRYQSAGELGRDIGHYLSGEPIEARRDSGWYVMKKQLQRYKVPVGLAAAFVLVITAGFVLSAALWRRADEQRQIAEREKGRADRKAADAEAARQTEVKSRETIEYNSYVANVQMAAAAMDFRQFDCVRARLDVCPERLRGWEWRWLNASADSSLFEFRGHTAQVTSASFSPDGTRIVMASWDDTARVWDAATGAILVELRGHTGFVLSAAFSPDGTRIVTTSADQTARVWDAATGTSLADLKGHTATVLFAAFSPDGTRIVTASWDDTARVWDAVTGASLAEIKGYTRWVSSAVFTGEVSAWPSPDGTRIIMASNGMSARVWDAATGASLAELRGHTAHVNFAAFSPDGTWVVTASLDGTARVWNAATGASLAELKGHAGPVSSAAFSPDGTRIATASWDKTARVWDAATKASLAELRGHTAQVTSASFSPDGTRIVTASYDKTARVWDTATGESLAELRGHASWVYSAAFSPDGTRIVTASEDQTARVWDAATEVSLAELKRHTAQVTSASFSPDGTRVVTASWDGTARVWDAATKAILAEPDGHTGAVLSAAFSPDGTRIVTASEDQTARVWDAATGASLVELKGHIREVNSAAFNPDGTRVVTASGDRTARVWDATTGASLVELKGHTDRVVSAAFSPDRTRIVTASWDHGARVWDAATGASLVELKGHVREVNSAAFNPDGTRVVTASGDKTARVWDATTGASLVELKGHTNWVVSAAFSPDGTRIVTASWDHGARVWDAATGESLAELRGHTLQVNSAAFSPDGIQIVTASWDRTARIWDSVPYRERFPAIQRRREVLVRVAPLVRDGFASGRTPDQVRSALLGDPALSPAERQAVQAALSRLVDLQAEAWIMAQRLNEAAWDVVRYAAVEPEAGAQALRDARRAVELAPEDGLILNTLGVAQYRMEQYEEALATLKRSDELNSRPENPRNRDASQGAGTSTKPPEEVVSDFGLPGDVAFIAMSLYKLGRAEEAHGALARLQKLMRQARWIKDEESQSFLREAESLILGQPATAPADTQPSKSAASPAPREN